MPGVLCKDDIRKLIEQRLSLIEEFTSLEEQLQPNGFDLTVREVAMPQSAGAIAVSNSRRVIPFTAPLVFDGLGSLYLLPGAYIITYNEIVNLPKNIMALATPRSSLLRCGVSIHTAVWDAGYRGRSTSLMVVHNTQGFTLEKNARVLQLVFFPLDRETEGYWGIYQGENT